jgi:hypothetical protein
LGVGGGEGGGLRGVGGEGLDGVGVGVACHGGGGGMC